MRAKRQVVHGQKRFEDMTEEPHNVGWGWFFAILGAIFGFSIVFTEDITVLWVLCILSIVCFAIGVAVQFLPEFEILT